MTPILFILLDAFRWDYLNSHDTPFLWQLSQQHTYVRQLIPGFGFCERSEIFTGTPPAITGNFTAINYAPHLAPLAKYKTMLTWLTVLQGGRLERYGRYALRKILRWQGIRLPVYHIPFELLPLMALTEDAHNHIEPDAFVVPSLFDTMRQAGRTLFYESFTALGWDNGDDQDRFTRLRQALGQPRDLYLLYVGASDAQIHVHGTESAVRRQVCQHLDTQLCQLYNQFQQIYPTGCMMVVGDHGMTDVHTSINVWKYVQEMAQQNGLQQGRDYILFLDSTLVRVWFLRPHSRKPFAALFAQGVFQQHGQLLTAELQELYQMPKTAEYGNLLWACHPGTLIFPDYFHRIHPMKAMHGYVPEQDSTKGMVIFTSPASASPHVHPSAHLIDLCPTLHQLLGLPIPTTCQGKSLLP